MKMKLIDKLNSIDKPKIEQLPQGKAITIENLWNDLLKKYLPDKETVIKWHNLLIEYIKSDKAVFAIRAFNNEKPERYGDLRRGFLTQTSNDYSFFYTDNYFSAFFYKMAMDKYVPDVEEFCSLLYERKFPSRFGQITSQEREMMAVKMGRDPGINKAGFKLSHIMNVGKGYYYGAVSNSKKLRSLFSFSNFLEGYLYKAYEFYVENSFFCINILRFLWKPRFFVVFLCYSS